MSCECNHCDCRTGGFVAVDEREYHWLVTCADNHVNLRDAAGRICDMALDPDFMPSDEFRMWVNRLSAELERDRA